MIVKIKAVLKKIYLSQWFIIAIIAMGSALRIRQYLANRSLWLDEAMLALNIVRYDYLDLLKPLDYGQAAPPLFLLISNFLTEIFGHSEYVLRLFPLIAGLSSLILFWRLAKKFLHKLTVPVAVFFLSFSRYAIYFSNEFKQYSVDLMVTIIILLLAVYVYEKGFNLKSSILFGLIGAFLVWLSHTSIFILTGTSLSLIAVLYLNERLKNKKKTIHGVLMSVIWIGSFFISYLSIVKDTAHQGFYDYWQSGFAPLITSFHDLRWYQSTLFEIIKNPINIYFPGVALLLLLAGFICFINKKEKIFFFFIFSPLFVIFAASLLKIYPISSRLILFTLPIFYLLILKGVEEFVFNSSKKNIILSIFLILLLISQPLYYSYHTLRAPRYRQESRQLIEYYQSHKSQEDHLYVYYSAEPAFLYYTRDTDEKFETLFDWGLRGVAIKQLDELEDLDVKGRAWFIFSHVYEDEEKIIVEKLNELGDQIIYVKEVGASLYLYDL